MKRFFVLAALAVAALVGASDKASADFTIQISGLDLVAGVATNDPLDFLKVGSTVIAAPTATTIPSLSLAGGTLVLSGTGFSPAATFTFTSLTTTSNTNGGSTISGMTTNFSVAASLIPAGQQLVSATLSITDPTTTAVFTGNFGGSIVVVTRGVVPEPASMAMLAMGGLGVLGAARRRRNA